MYPAYIGRLVRCVFGFLPFSFFWGGINGLGSGDAGDGRIRTNHRSLSDGREVRTSSLAPGEFLYYLPCLRYENQPTT